MLELIGLVPAAGYGKRLGPLPCSKEIYPVRIDKERAALGDTGHVTVAAEFLLAQFRTATAKKAYVIVRDGKWDIPAYLKDGEQLGVSLAYLHMRHPFGAPFTLDAAYPFVRHAQVLLGFPDILIDLDDPYGPLLDRSSETGADVVLGLLPARRPEKVDMVELDDQERVRKIVIKPGRTALRYTWLFASWGPRFSGFLHDYVAEEVARGREEADTEIHVGDVIRTALEAGLAVEAVRFDGASYIDIGTPEDLRAAVER